MNVVSLNETWLCKETENKFNIPGFNYIGKVRSGKNGGGVGLLISEEIRFRELPNLLLPLIAFESICIEIKTKMSSVLVLSMYRPPNVSLDAMLNDIRTFLKVLKKENRPVIICTDHNLDLLKSEYHHKTQEFLETLTDVGFISTITKPTRLTHHSATLINKYLASDYISLVLYEDISDHLPCVVCIKNFEHDRKQHEMVYRRKIDKKAIDCMKHDLGTINWESELKSLNCESSFNLFHKKLVTSLDKYASECSVLKKCRKSVQPWVTSSIKKCLNKQKILYKNSIENKQDGNLRKKYKDYRSCLQQLLRNCKRNYYSDLCTKHRTNTKKMWGVNDCLAINGIKTHDAEQIAQELG